MKNHEHKICAAVGDGGNDVTMILEANCGIGVVGKEGKSAALSSDFQINKLMDLQKLILVHGRAFMLRSSVVSHILIHQGLLMGVVQILFILTTNPNKPFTCFDGLLMLGYDTTFTKLVLIAFFPDFDVADSVALNNPTIYKELKANSSILLNVRTVTLNFLVSTVQALVIFYLPVSVFSDCQGTDGAA